MNEKIFIYFITFITTALQYQIMTSKVTSNIMKLLKFACSQSTAMFKHAVVPYKKYDYFRCYFETTEKMAILKDHETIFVFKVYFFLLLYFIILNAILYLFPVNYFIRVLLFDTVQIIIKDELFYYVYFFLTFYTFFLFKSLYFTPNLTLHASFKNVLFAQEKSASLNRLQIKKKKGTEVKNQFLLTFNQRVLLQQKALLILNSLQVFILQIDVFFLIVTMIIGRLFLQSSYHLFLSCNFNKVLALLGFCLLLLVYFFHIFLTIIFWYSFSHSLILMATFCSTGFAYLCNRFKQNYVQLRKALSKSCKRKEKNYGFLVRALKKNASNFVLVFTFDGFIGRQFLVFLVLHMPTSAFFLMKIALGQDNEITRFIMLGLVLETYVGSLVIHLWFAFFTEYIHQSGKMLLSFNAGKDSLCLTPRARLTISLHIYRLWVNKKYGITYAGN